MVIVVSVSEFYTFTWLLDIMDAMEDKRKKKKGAVLWDVASTALSYGVWCTVMCMVVRAQMYDTCKGAP